MAAPPRQVERIKNFFSRIGLPPDHDYMAQFTQRAQQAQEAGDPTLVDRAKRQCSGMLGFTQYRFPRYRPSDVHRVVCAQLERVEAREIDRLMLLMPPRHGKSELASKSYPAWSIGRKPWKQFISGSASMPLAQDWGREVRNIVNSDAFQLVFETRLSADSQAAGKWNTQQGGSYYSVGVEGGVMGRGAHDIMLDDLYANMEEAASPVIREKVWKWYSGTILIPATSWPGTTTTKRCGGTTSSAARQAAPYIQRTYRTIMRSCRSGDPSRGRSDGSGRPSPSGRAGPQFLQPRRPSARVGVDETVHHEGSAGEGCWGSDVGQYGQEAMRD